jgi:hypothetical protein
VDLRKHQEALERFRTSCSRILGKAADLTNTLTGDVGSEKLLKKASAHVDFHISLSHTQPAAYTQRKTLLKGLRKACEGWRPLNLKLDTVQVRPQAALQPESTVHMAAAVGTVWGEV